MNINHKLAVHAYKFNGCLYRTFEFPKLVYKNNDFLILDLSNCRVISQGKNKKFYRSHFQINSLWIFFYEQWYNLFLNITKNNNFVYYFNVATPYLFEEDAIKYIDLDLDIRVENINTNFEKIKVLDMYEFEHHSQVMLYPKKLINKSIETKNQLINDLKSHKFQKKFNFDFFSKINNLIKRNLPHEKSN